jgi:uncharacterized membrane protein
MRGDIKLGVRSNLIAAGAAGAAVALAFLLLGDTGLGYAVVAAIIVTVVLYLIFETVA